MTARRLPVNRTAFKRGLLVLALLAGTGTVAFYGHKYWTTGRYLESTNDAYVKADYTTIAPKVSGYIASVLVKDNESVRAGQVLARIDDRDFRAALDEALAKVEASQAAIRNLDAQIALQQSMIEQARAQVVATQATLVFAKADAERYHDLVRTGAGTLQRSQQTQSLRDATVAQLRRDEAALAATEARVAVLTSERDQAVAQRARDEATAEQARLNLGYMTIVAPVPGTVGARSLRIGQRGIVEMEVAGARPEGPADHRRRAFRRLKAMGFSDARLAKLTHSDDDDDVRASVAARSACGPVYKRIDTCAAEFASPTAYMYSTYETPFAGAMADEARPSDKKKVVILGGGPNRIGQGIEFDYCCCHACFALEEAGYETIMVNCNPETVSTDYDTSDRLYFEPLTAGRRARDHRHRALQRHAARRDRPVRRPDAAQARRSAGEGQGADPRHLAGRDRPRGRPRPLQAACSTSSSCASRRTASPTRRTQRAPSPTRSAIRW